MKTKKIPYYIVNLRLTTRTKDQANLVRKTLMCVYEKMVDEWGGRLITPEILEKNKLINHNKS